MSTSAGHSDECEDFYPEYGPPEGGVCRVCGEPVRVTNVTR